MDLLTSPKTSDLHCAVLQTDFDFDFFFPCRLPLCLWCVHCINILEQCVEVARCVQVASLKLVIVKSHPTTNFEKVPWEEMPLFQPKKSAAQTKKFESALVIRFVARTSHKDVYLLAC